MIIKIHQSYRLTIAICDSDLIGQKFEDENRQLDLTGAFFKGDEKSTQEIVEIMADMKREDATFFIVGKESVNLALQTGLILKKGIITIQEIPVSLVLL